MSVALTLLDAWHGPDGPGVWWGPLSAVLLFAIVVAVGLYFSRRYPGMAAGPRSSEHNAEQVLAARFARGDISEEEYVARLNVLRDHRDR